MIPSDAVCGRLRLLAKPIALAVALGMLGFAVPRDGRAETCLSPFVKRLDRPEKFLYVFCVDADAKDNDFLAVDRRATRSRRATARSSTSSTSARRATRRTTSATPTTAPTSGACTPVLQPHLPHRRRRPTRPSRSWSRCSTTSAPRPASPAPHSPYALPGRMLHQLPQRQGRRPAGRPGRVHQRRQVHPQHRHARRTPPTATTWPSSPTSTAWSRRSFTSTTTTRSRSPRWTSRTSATSCSSGTSASASCCRRSRPALAPLECRWSLKEGANHGFTNCALDNSIWVWEGDKDGKYTTRKLCDTGKLPADLRQSPDDRYLFVSCFGSDEIQQWDVSDLKNPKLHSTLKPGVQPEHDARHRRRQAHVHHQLAAEHDGPHDRTSGSSWRDITPDGLKLDPDFDVDLTKLPTGPARGHDMLLN